MRAFQPSHSDAGHAISSAGVAAAFWRAAASFAASVVRSASRESLIAAEYQGRGWCDATERELNQDIIRYRCTRG